MGILVPLKDGKHIDDYINLGADEFYIGFDDINWYEEFGTYQDLNRMSGYRDANLLTLDEMIRIVNYIKSKGKKIYVTFNANLYFEKELERIEEYFCNLSHTNVDGIIISGEELIPLANKYNLNIVLSTMCGIYNEDILKYYVDLGIKRVILPRELQITEISEIKKLYPDIEVEVFIMRNGCIFSDSNCLGLHMQEFGSLCTWLKNSQKNLYSLCSDFQTKHDFEINNMLYNNYFHMNTCGLCALYCFEQIGISSYKIVGRSDDWKAICNDIELLKYNIDLIKNCINNQEYLERMKFPKNQSAICKLGMCCYYPEIRFNK